MTFPASRSHQNSVIRGNSDYKHAPSTVVATGCESQYGFFLAFIQEAVVLQVAKIVLSGIAPKHAHGDRSQSKPFWTRAFLQ